MFLKANKRLTPGGGDAEGVQSLLEGERLLQVVGGAFSEEVLLAKKEKKIFLGGEVESVERVFFFPGGFSESLELEIFWGGSFAWWRGIERISECF